MTPRCKTAHTSFKTWLRGTNISVLVLKTLSCSIQAKSKFRQKMLRLHRFCDGSLWLPKSPFYVNLEHEKTKPRDVALSMQSTFWATVPVPWWNLRLCFLGHTGHIHNDAQLQLQAGGRWVSLPSHWTIIYLPGHMFLLS